MRVFRNEGNLTSLFSCILYPLSHLSSFRLAFGLRQAPGSISFLTVETKQEFATTEAISEDPPKDDAPTDGNDPFSYSHFTIFLLFPFWLSDIALFSGPHASRGKNKLERLAYSGHGRFVRLAFSGLWCENFYSWKKGHSSLLSSWKTRNLLTLLQFLKHNQWRPLIYIQPIRGLLSDYLQ